MEQNLENISIIKEPKDSIRKKYKKEKNKEEKNYHNLKDITNYNNNQTLKEKDINKINNLQNQLKSTKMLKTKPDIKYKQLNNILINKKPEKEPKDKIKINKNEKIIESNLDKNILKDVSKQNIINTNIKSDSKIIQIFNKDKTKINNAETNKNYIIYNISEKGKGKKISVKIFGKLFVENNKDNIKIIYNNKEYDLTEYFEVDSKENSLKIKITKIGDKLIKDLAHMFYDCSSLISLPDDFINGDISKVDEISYMFYNCTSLISLPETIKNLDTSNIRFMTSLFQGCSSLTTLPEGIKNWDTSNVYDMMFLFRNCFSLISLPDISRWNTIKTYSMLGIFENCYSLISLPNIRKWKTPKLKSVNSIFNGCLSLTYLPKIDSTYHYVETYQSEWKFMYTGELDDDSYYIYTFK